MTRRLVASLLVALLAPTAAFACAMPRRLEAKALTNVMAEIDAAAAPVAAPAPVAPPAQAAVAVEVVAPVAAATVPATSLIAEVGAARTK